MGIQIRVTCQEDIEPRFRPFPEDLALVRADPGFDVMEDRPCEMEQASSILLPDGAAGAMPTQIVPMLAVPGEMPPDPQRWGFEFKWDGVRALCFWDGASMRLHSRNRLDITHRYPELHALGAAMEDHTAVLDGEIVALDEMGRPSFGLLQRRMHVNDPRAIARLCRQSPVWYVLFDLLWMDGRSLMPLAYEQRRRILEGLTLAGPYWQVTPAVIGDGEAMLEAARQNALEGVIAKRLDSPYIPGRRSPAWRKIKIIPRQEFVIGGWIPEKQTRSGRVGAMLIGYFDCDGKLRYAGSVGTGLDDAAHARLAPLFRKHTGSANPFAGPVPKKGVRFLKPVLVAEVEYRRWPTDGLVHQSAFKGLRSDKRARDVVREQA